MLAETAPSNIPTYHTKSPSNDFVQLDHLVPVWTISGPPKCQQTLVFYRKPRKFFILTQLALQDSFSSLAGKAAEISAIEDRFNFIQKCDLSQICTSNSSTIAIFNEIPIGTLSDYLKFMSDEKKSCMQDRQLCSIFERILHMMEGLSAFLSDVDFTPEHIILTETGELKLLDAVLYLARAGKLETDAPNKLIRFITKFFCQITHPERSKDQLEPKDYAKLIQTYYPRLREHILALEMPTQTTQDIETPENHDFAMAFRENKTQFLFYRYAKIIDCIPLESTMKDHFAISDQLTLDRELYDQFWSYYLENTDDPLQAATRRYRYARHRNLFFGERVSKKEYLLASELLQDIFKEAPSLEMAAVYDGLACNAFSEGSYETSRKFLEMSLDMIQKIHGPNSSFEAIIHSNLTHVLTRLGLKEEAKESTNRAVQITLKYSKEDDIFFTVLHGNYIILTFSDDEKGEWLKKSVELKKAYWGDDHPNVHLTIHNFYNLAKRAYGSEFPYTEQTYFDINRMESHIKYYGETHHSPIEIARSVLYKLYFSKKDCVLLQFLAKMRKNYKFVDMFPLEEEFKGKILKRANNPLAVGLTKCVYHKERRLKKINANVCPTWILGNEYPYWSSQRDLEKNIIYSLDLKY